MNRPQQGFTLIEILVAVSISSILLVSIYGVFTAMSNAKIRVETEGEAYHQARVIFDRIGREIRSSYVDPNKLEETRMRGGIDDRGIPFLALATNAGTPRQGRVSGSALIRYELRQEADDTAGKASLFRSEGSDLVEGEPATTYRMARGIETLRVRFLGDGEWLDEWPPDIGSAEPRAVEVTLSMVIDGTPVPFRSAFEVPKN
jgi:general secretion pathway protein J